MNETVQKSFSIRGSINRLMFMTNVLVAVALLISHFGAAVNPSKLWLFELIAISYPLWLILNIGFVIYWLIQFHRFILLSLIAIVITYPKPGLFFQMHIISIFSY